MMVHRRSHKTGVERLLMTARAKIALALACVDEPDPEELLRLKEELEAADRALRAAELQLGAARFSVSNFEGREGQRQTEHQDLETKTWLLSTFTEEDFEASEQHSQLRSVVSKITLARQQSMDEATSHRHSGSYRHAHALRGARHRMSAAQLGEHVSRAMSNETVVEALEKSGDWDFDAIHFATLPESRLRPISVLGAYQLQETALIVDLKEQDHIEGNPKEFEQAFATFLGRMDTLYRSENAYHGPVHAVDVMSTMMWFMKTEYFEDHATKIDLFMSLVAAAIHDVGHPGRNNDFHKKTMSDMAISYNDKSILENMHVALCFQTIQKDRECDWFRLLRKQRAGADGRLANLQQYMRKGLISMVLATDNAKHSKHQKQLEAFIARDQEDTSPAAEKIVSTTIDEQLFLLGSALHAADVSNPCKPHDIMFAWTRRLLEEFWIQGDEERSLGFTSLTPLSDRNTGRLAVPKGQIGFVDFIIKPYYGIIRNLLPEVQLAFDQLERNRAFWVEQDEEKKTYEQLWPEPFSVLPRDSVRPDLGLEEDIPHRAYCKSPSKDGSKSVTFFTERRMS